jgi:hypothetical protein
LITDGLKQTVTTSLTLGVQLDDFDYRLFLRDYHRDLRARFPQEDGFPAYSPAIVLDALMDRLLPGARGAGGRREELRGFCKRVYRQHLSLGGSDYGDHERRTSPYSFDRATYHIGRELTVATLENEYPGHNPYRSTRKLNIMFVRDEFDGLVELLPDYLWWALHDKKDLLQNALAPEQLGRAREQIARAGFKIEAFGLYLVTFESIRRDEA